MRIGDVIESAVWLTGEESPELRKHYETDVAEAIDYLCHENRFLYGPVSFTEKKPGTDRVPEVPDHIHGVNVRLLVAEAEIIGRKPDTSNGSFIANLDKVDLDRLRTITRNARMKLYRERLTDAECDEVIEAIGPDAALDTLRKQVKPFGIVH